MRPRGPRSARHQLHRSRTDNVREEQPGGLHERHRRSQGQTKQLFPTATNFGLTGRSRFRCSRRWRRRRSSTRCGRIRHGFLSRARARRQSGQDRLKLIGYDDSLNHRPPLAITMRRTPPAGAEETTMRQYTPTTEVDFVVSGRRRGRHHGQAAVAAGFSVVVLEQGGWESRPRPRVQQGRMV